MKTPTVYTALSGPDRDGDRIWRMALHPVLDDAPICQGPKFPCRVAWRCVEWGSWVAWRGSCRSSGSPGVGTFGLGSDGLGGGGPDNDADAIAWLLEGEAG